MDVTDNSRQLAAAPKARVCYVCGRQYMVHSFDIHIKQCKELFLAREALKDPRDRKKLPEDPVERMMRGGGGGDDGTGSPDRRSTGGGSAMNSPAPGGGGGSTEGMSLDEINRMATDAYNNEALSKCAFCGRTFLPEKLAIHNKSCTAENPARKVSEGVRKGIPTPDISSGGELPRRPATSSGPSSSSASKPKRVQLPAESAGPGESSSSNNDGTHLKLENGELRGHIGGAAGRSIRAPKPSSSNTPIDNSPIPDFASKDEGIEYLTTRLDMLEGVAGDIFNAIVDVKKALGKIKNLP